MSKKLLSPEAARDFLVRRFNNQHQNWLAGDGTWPLVVTLGVPTDKDIAEDASAVRAWAAAWQSRTGPGEVLFEERQFARFGKHRLPSRLSFESAAVVAAAVGQSRRWEIASERYQRMLSRWPVLTKGNALASRFDVLADYSAEDFERLQTLIAWLTANPASGLYLRQLPVEGLDTKWLEKRTGLVAGLLRAISGTGDDGGDLHALVGLKKPAHRVRIRLLCPTLRSIVGGLGDIEAPVDELGRLPISPASVVIVENLETGLALPDVANTVLVMKLGNAVSALGALPWLQEADVVYWGDIDSHGFAILDRARKAVPQIRSILMDEATLLAHRPLWVQESALCANMAFDGLTPEEKSLYEHLRAGTWGGRVRLEQERLEWAGSLKALMEALALPRLQAYSLKTASSEKHTA
ncbi:Wadjet anti-phage system protein JetD domain-containing protein [Variovorax sp. HJSM1_2]|uniref:Wadjet anti-phage system protein JetD domain-containing protein n=1 Tax=Variovorax sp. HJSM1_2 TaxID=3366263 RepID=UPI003BEE0CA6